MVDNARPGWLAGIERYHLLVFLGCWLGGIFDGMDSSLYMVVQADAIAEVAHTVDRAVISQMGSWIMATFLFGWVAGGICFGVIGDRFGRVTAMIFSILLYALFTGAAGFAHTPEQLAFCRFLTGFGIGGELVTIATMLSETWPEASRAMAVGMLITSYQVGVFLAGLIPAVVYDQVVHWPLFSGFTPWRIVFFFGVLPAVLAIFLRLNLKEPEKWELAHAARKATEAQSDQGLAAQFQAGWRQLQAIFAPGHRRDVFVGAAIFGGLLIGYWASLAWIPTWIQDIIGPGGSGTEKSVATMYHGIAAVAGCALSGWVANAIGRRWTIAIAYLGSFAATALLTLTNTAFTPAIFWQDALLGFFIGMSQAIMYVYLPELFPTRIRASAVGFCLNAGRVLTAVAVLFVGMVTLFFGGYAMAILAFSASYLVAVAMGLVGRETNGVPLPD
ncbi:MAG: MFS transporter [Candidatus Melainabacteria bacterium]